MEPVNLDILRELEAKATPGPRAWALGEGA